jgi:hypothetical protein
MKKLLLILLCLPMIGFGQSWEQTFLGNTYNFYLGHSVQQTIDGGYITVGEFKINYNQKVWLIKTDGNGQEEWNRTFGNPNLCYTGKSVLQTIDGGYIAVANVSYTFQKNMSANDSTFVMKTDNNGIEQWNTILTGISYVEEIQPTIDGGYVLVGTGATNVALKKIDLNGIEVWHQTLGGAGYDYGNSVQQTTDGGYIITGSTESFGNGDMDVYLIKTYANGQEQWYRTFDDVGFSDEGYSVQQTTDGGYIITGRTGWNIWLIKTDGNGQEIWNQTFDYSGYECGRSVQQTTDGGYIIAGGTQSNPQGLVHLTKTDGNGQEQWNRILQLYGAAYAVQQTTDGGYIVSGSSSGNTTGYNALFLVKTDSQGNITSTFNIPINPNRKLQKTVDILGKETKPKTNTPFIEIYDDGTVEKRIVIE